MLISGLAISSKVYMVHTLRRPTDFGAHDDFTDPENEKDACGVGFVSVLLSHLCINLMPFK